MERHEVDAFTLDIFIAGDIDVAKQVCRKFCMDVGLCVTVSPTTYIYTGGEETGVRVGLIHYARFPTTPDDLLGKADALGLRLMEALCQHSYSIVGLGRSAWVTRRPV